MLAHNALGDGEAQACAARIEPRRREGFKEFGQDGNINTGAIIDDAD